MWYERGLHNSRFVYHAHVGFKTYVVFDLPLENFPALELNSLFTLGVRLLHLEQRVGFVQGLEALFLITPPHHLLLVRASAGRLENQPTNKQRARNSIDRTKSLE